MQLPAELIKPSLHQRQVALQYVADAGQRIGTNVPILPAILRLEPGDVAGRSGHLAPSAATILYLTANTVRVSILTYVEISHGWFQ